MSNSIQAETLGKSSDGTEKLALKRKPKAKPADKKTAKSSKTKRAKPKADDVQVDKEPKPIEPLVTAVEFMPSGEPYKPSASVTVGGELIWTGIVNLKSNPDRKSLCKRIAGAGGDPAAGESRLNDAFIEASRPVVEQQAEPEAEPEIPELPWMETEGWDVSLADGGGRGEIAVRVTLNGERKPVFQDDGRPVDPPVVSSELRDVPTTAKWLSTAGMSIEIADYLMRKLLLDMEREKRAKKNSYSCQLAEMSTPLKPRIRFARGETTLRIEDMNPASAQSRKRTYELLEPSGYPKEQFDREMVELAEQLTINATKPSAEVEEAGPTNEELLAKMPAGVIAEAEAMLKDPMLLRRISEDLKATGSIGEVDLSLLIYLTGVSRLLPKPINAIVQGKSSSGKTFTVNRVERLFPPHVKVVASQISSNALFYAGRSFLKNKFVVAGERSRSQDEDSQNSTRSLREMMSQGKISKFVTIKDDTGRPKSFMYEADGPIAYVETTTLENIFDEDRNRCILVRTDESQAQTRRVMLAVAASRTGGSKLSELDSAIVAKHHAMQLMLKPTPIAIPYAVKIAEVMSNSVVECRRAVGSLFDCIEASVLLHQFQRETVNGSLVATFDDYVIAHGLVVRAMTESVGGGVTDAAGELWDWLSDRVGEGKEFSSNDLLAQEDCPAKRTTLYQLINELEEKKCLRFVRSERRLRYHVLYQSPNEASSPIPNPKEFRAILGLSGG